LTLRKLVDERDRGASDLVERMSGAIVVYTSELAVQVASLGYVRRFAQIEIVRGDPAAGD